MMKTSSFRMIGSLIAALMCVFISGQSASAGFKEGMDAHSRGDYSTALKKLRPLAERGNANAQHNLGVMFQNGYDVSQDHMEAVMWYRKSAKQGLAYAQSNMGVMYDNGHGVSQDYKKAEK